MYWCVNQRIIINVLGDRGPNLISVFGILSSLSPLPGPRRSERSTVTALTAAMTSSEKVEILNIQQIGSFLFSTLSCDKTKSYVFFQPKDKVCPIIFLHELFVSCPAQDEENNISLGCIAWASRRKRNEMWMDNSPRFQGTPRLSGQWSHRVPGGGWEQRERSRGARRVHHHPLHEAQGE